MDLRSRTLAAIDAGTSCLATVARFGVAPSTAVRWRDQQRRTGSYEPKPQGGDNRSKRIETHQAAIFALCEAQRDITLDELRHALAKDGVVVAVSTLHRCFVRRGFTRKKRLHTPLSKSAPTS
jgi:transposase